MLQFVFGRKITRYLLPDAEQVLRFLHLSDFLSLLNTARNFAKKMLAF
jgi:hypothetical protein